MLSFMTPLLLPPPSLQSCGSLQFTAAHRQGRRHASLPMSGPPLLQPNPGLHISPIGPAKPPFPLKHNTSCTAVRQEIKCNQ